MDVIYIYDGTFYGLLTSVFYVYSRKEEPLDICTDKNLQLVLGAETFNVTTDVKKAERVIKSAAEKIGKDGFFHIYKAYLSEADKREITILKYLRLVFSMGRGAESYYKEKTVTDIMKMARKTGNEAHLFLGFLRFKETEQGIFYSEFSPETDCISLVAPHFKSRLSGLSFAINDVKRKKAAIWDKEKLDIIYYENYDAPTDTENEKAFRAMWKSFYKKVTIDERKNEKCRMTNMPKRFWRYMCEMSEF